MPVDSFNQNRPVAKTQNVFADVPPLMKYIIDSVISAELNALIEKNNRLTSDQGDAMMKLIRKVILKTIQPAELIGAIQREVGLDSDRAKKLALDLLGYRFLPMEWYVGPVQAYIHDLGGNVQEYLREARKNYPEVYSPKTVEPSAASEGGAETHPILRDFESRIGTNRGKAEILLRLTGLSAELESAVQAGQLEAAEGQRLMQQLEAVSYAINTRDLNPFEIQSIRRQLNRLIDRIEGLSQ